MWSTFLFEASSPESKFLVEFFKLFVSNNGGNGFEKWWSVLGRKMMRVDDERSEVRVVMRSLLQRVDPLKTEEIISEHLVHAQHVDSTV